MTATKPRNIVDHTKTHEKVWNITDHPGTAHKPSVRMIAGKATAPGRHASVPLESLPGGKRFVKDVEDRILHVGDHLPADYLKATGRGRPARVGKKAKRSHGGEVGKAVAKASVPKKALPKMPPPSAEKKGESKKTRKVGSRS